MTGWALLVQYSIKMVASRAEWPSFFSLCCGSLSIWKIIVYLSGLRFFSSWKYSHYCPRSRCIEFSVLLIEPQGTPVSPPILKKKCNQIISKIGTALPFWCVVTVSERFELKNSNLRNLSFVGFESSSLGEVRWPPRIFRRSACRSVRCDIVEFSTWAVHAEIACWVYCDSVSRGTSQKFPWLQYSSQHRDGAGASQIWCNFWVGSCLNKFC